MSENHRYILEPYEGMKTRHRCPQCSKANKLSRYVDTESSEHIADHVGRCDRESSCGYHYTPKQYFHDNNISLESEKQYYKTQKTFTPQPQKPASFISVDLFKKSLQIDKNTLQIAETNHFVKYLVQLFGTTITSDLISKYFIGTSKHWSGSTVFWQIDLEWKIRTGKIMLYNPENGKRIKEPFNLIHWVHKAIKQPEFKLKQCFFAEHLLKENIKPIALVESEKTAIIASVYLPQFVWLAVGSLTNLNAEKCKVLQGKKVVLFPDIKAFDKWDIKAKEFGFEISDLLEKKATDIEREQGLDLADYLIRYDYRSFLGVETQKTTTQLIIDENDIKTLHCVFVYDGYQVQTILTKQGKFIDVLFNNDGDLLPPTKEIDGYQIGTFYNQPALMMMR